MTGVHGLQHVQRFPATAFADHDAVRTHSEAVHDEIADRHLAPAFDVWWAGLQRDDVLLPELELGRVLYRDDPLIIGNEPGKDVQ